jgi:hypothetical protein
MTYRNTFYNSHNTYSKQTLSCDDKYIREYRGYFICHRVRSTVPSGDCFDIVNAFGECVGMYAGINGAKLRIDEITLEVPYAVRTE